MYTTTPIGIILIAVIYRRYPHHVGKLPISHGCYKDFDCFQIILLHKQLTKFQNIRGQNSRIINSRIIMLALEICLFMIRKFIKFRIDIFNALGLMDLG